MNFYSKVQEISLGQHFYNQTGLHDECVVVNIEGDQSTRVDERGDAYFTLIDTKTNTSFKIPEFILRSPKWLARNVISTLEEIESLILKDKAAKEAARQIIEEDKKRFNAAVEALKTDENYQHLTPIDNNYTNINVAKNIRADLKNSFGKAVKFSVRVDGNAIRIRYADKNVTIDDVNFIVKKFQHGTFNGMNDSYEHEPSPFNSAFGGCNYVFVTNDGFKL